MLSFQAGEKVMVVSSDRLPKFNGRVGTVKSAKWVDNLGDYYMVKFRGSKEPKLFFYWELLKATRFNKFMVSKPMQLLLKIIFSISYFC